MSEETQNATIEIPEITPAPVALTAEDMIKHREEIAAKAYGIIAEELKDANATDGGFPAWEAITERGKCIYIEAVRACWDEGSQRTPLTRYEAIVMGLIYGDHQPASDIGQTFTIHAEGQISDIEGLQGSQIIDLTKDHTVTIGQDREVSITQEQTE